MQGEGAVRAWPVGRRARDDRGVGKNPVIQSRLPTNDSDAYHEVGGLITFLAKSGRVEAIAALGQYMRKAPVEVRLAVVQVFARPSGQE